MKVLIFIISVLVLIGCNPPKRIINNQDIRFEKSEIVIADSTKEPGYNPKQRAFYWYLRSLPDSERQKWVSSGSFTEQEKDTFLNKIDSLQMDIQLPDPPNSTIPDTLKK
jgi:hypothetical protein